jgi:hypothetical protein
VAPAAALGQSSSALGAEAALVQGVHRDEMFALAVYRDAARAPAGRVRELAVAFRDHETKHVAALATALEALGSPRLHPPEGAVALDRESRRLGIDPVLSARRGARARLRFLLELEERLLAAWLHALPQLSQPNLVRLAGEALGCQAQHAVALREALGREALPGALERGRA